MHRTVQTIAKFIFALVFAAGLTHAPVRASEAALDKIHKNIVKRYRSVKHITSDALTTRLANPEDANDIVLFDVRKVAEHNVSHLKNASQITPGIWTSTFLRKHGARIKGKTVVFYCSVGRRSSRAASYLQAALKKNGAKEVYNLKGGIFSWHNQSRPLNRGVASTDGVHPYDKYWGRLIERKHLIRFKPASNEISETNASSQPAQ